MFTNIPDYYYSLLVQGTPLIEKAKPLISLSATESAAGSSSSVSPSYKGLGGGAQRNCVVKVVRAKKNVAATGKMEFTGIDNIYINVTPSTANIHYILSEVQEKWGTDYVVVSNDGLKIGDSPATRGKNSTAVRSHCSKRKC